MNERSPDEFDEDPRALRGEVDAGHETRLGERLRARHREALAARDVRIERRTWYAIEARLGATARPRTHWGAGGWARAAALVGIGIAAGWLLRPAPDIRAPASRLEFAYGDLERPRGGYGELRVHAADPVSAASSIGAALIADGVPFEIYSLGEGDARRLLFAWPDAEVPHAAAALRAMGLSPVPGSTYSLTLSHATPGTE